MRERRKKHGNAHGRAGEIRLPLIAQYAIQERAPPDRRHARASPSSPHFPPCRPSLRPPPSTTDAYLLTQEHKKRLGAVHARLRAHLDRRREAFGNAGRALLTSRAPDASRQRPWQAGGHRPPRVAQGAYAAPPREPCASPISSLPPLSASPFPTLSMRRANDSSSPAPSCQAAAAAADQPAGDVMPGAACRRSTF